MIRTFIAVELSDALRATIAGIQEDVKRELGHEKKLPRLRWVRPQSIHLTLKFLGEIEAERVDEVLNALAAVTRTQTVFSVDVQGIGVFPDARAPRVLWVGVVGGERLVKLATAVEDALEPLSVARESRPFRPHLTLARIKEGGREIGRALSEHGVLDASRPVGTLEVRSMAFMSSELHPGGSIYRRLGEVELTGPTRKAP